MEGGFFIYERVTIMAINIDNLNAAFSAATKTVQEMNNISRQELVPLDDIVVAEFNPYNENDDDETVDQLARSIEAYGLIEPLCVNKDVNGKYHLISGERRYKSISRLGWKTIPCVVYDGLEAVQAELRLHEANLETREYTAAQKFSFYKRVRALLLQLKEEGKLSGGLQKNIANMLHISERQVRKYDSIAELPEEVQSAVTDGTLTINAAYNISQKQSENAVLTENEVVENCKDDDDDDNINDEAQDGDFKDENTENRKSVFEKITEESGNILDEREWQKYLEKAILSFYAPEKLMKYYIVNLPTPQEAANEILKPSGGYRGYCESKIDITATSNTFLVGVQGIRKSFKYSEVDSCVRDMIRSGRLLEKQQHQKLTSLINEFLEEC